MMLEDCERTLEEWELELGGWARSTDGASCEIVASPWLDSIEQAAMACEFEVMLNHGQYPQGLEAARDALRIVHALEEQLSVYRPLSDFSSINRFAHSRPISVHYDVARLIALALDVSRATERAFDITAGSLSEVWGFSRRQGRKPDDDQLKAALALVGSDQVQVDLAASSVQLLREGVRLNPGGIGKGYALDRLASNLVEAGLRDFLVHGGRSSVAARGQRFDGGVVDVPDPNATDGSAEVDSAALGGNGWWIAVAHPLRWEEKLGRVRLRNQALGTSGAGKQFFHYQGVRYSHVIDPRTGWPAQGVLSATAICGSGALADALATAFMVMGTGATREFCQDRPSIGAILVSTQADTSRLEIELVNVSDDDWRMEREL